MEKINFSYLEMLGENDDAFKVEFIATFEETYIYLVKRMREALKNSDLENLAKSAHQLKPSAQMIQLRCGETLEKLQYDPKKASKEIIDEINRQCEDALKQLKNWAGK